MIYLPSNILKELRQAAVSVRLTHPNPSLFVRPVWQSASAQQASKWPVYALYRVIVASYLLVLFIKLHHDEAHSQRGPRWELLMHYGYWAFLLLTIDFFLQAVSCVVYQLWMSATRNLQMAQTTAVHHQRRQSENFLTRVGQLALAKTVPENWFAQMRRASSVGVDQSRLQTRRPSQQQQPEVVLVPPLYRVSWFFHTVSLIVTPVSFGMFITHLYEGRLFRMSRINYYSDFDGVYHWVGFALLGVDFCVSSVPVRLLHFYLPLCVALIYNIALIIFTGVTRGSKGPLYCVADYLSPQTEMWGWQLVYFLTYGLILPLASYMVVYGLHVLRLYLVERVARLERVAIKDVFPVSSINIVYEKLRSRRHSSVTPERTAPERGQTNIVNVEKSADGGSGKSKQRPAGLLSRRKGKQGGGKAGPGDLSTVPSSAEVAQNIDDNEDPDAERVIRLIDMSPENK